jgi:uncharacterized protein (DUF1800 family)
MRAKTNPMRLRAAAALGAIATLLAACGGGGADAPAAPAAADGGERQRALAVSAANVVTQRDAVRLADQASFGASEALVNQIRTQGVEPWLAAQFAATGSSYTGGGDDLIHKPDGTDFCATRPNTCYRDYYSADPLKWDFFRNATTQADQLRQRVAFALSQIVVVSELEVSGTYGMRFYHNMLLANAFGNYREVLRRVTLSPLMGDYLDHVNNNRRNPNENYGRELLQLFAIGTCRLNLDGTLEGGRCTPTYDNDVVRNYAFALTGWTYPDGGTATYQCFPTGANCPYYQGDMVARQALADNVARTLLGGVSVPATRTPAQALDLVLNSLMSHPSMAPFIAKQLIQHLVKSNPTPDYVRRVATAFNAGTFAGTTRSFGGGARGDLTATVAAILLDSEARNSAPPLVAEKLREPVLMMTGVIRALNGRTDGFGLYNTWGENLRQHVFRAPSVFSFFPPNYPVAGTPLVGPAFGIYNTNTAFTRLNFLNQMLYRNGIAADTTIPAATGTQVVLTDFEADATDPVVLVNRMANLATGGRMTSATRSRIVTAVSAWTSAQSASWRTERVRTAAYLIFGSPAWQTLN